MFVPFMNIGLFLYISRYIVGIYYARIPNHDKKKVEQNPH